MDTKKFLNELFEYKPKDALIAIWEIPSKKTRRFKDINQAAAYIGQKKETKSDIYFGCGLQGKNLGPHKRGSRKDIIGIPGFYMDIDIKSDVHKAENLPPDINAAMSLIMNNGYDPTIVVHTGNGIHAHWIFKEPEMFENDVHRHQIETMCQRLQETIKQRATEKGWSLDSTWDIARVLRPPGTANYKDMNNPVDVKVIKNHGPKYADPMGFDQWLVAKIDVQKSATVIYTGGGQIDSELVLNQMAEPPAYKLDMLMEIDAKFKASWQGKREDMKDQSTSGYAMSLASRSAAAGWTDQEIANLIIAWYRRHEKDMKKALRLDYLAVTIAKARKPIQEQVANQDIVKANALRGTPYETEEIRKKALVAASEKLGIEIIRIDRLVADTPAYVMHTAKGDVELPSIDYLIRPRNLQSKIAAQLGIFIRYNKRQWPHIAQVLLDACCDVELSPDALVKGRMKLWLDEYLINYSELSFSEAIEGAWGLKINPFVKNGHWYIHLQSFWQWAWRHHGFTDSSRKLQIELKRSGCESELFNVTIFSKKTTRNFWKIPKGMINPLDSL
jgi:hypothetical protein